MLFFHSQVGVIFQANMEHPGILKLVSQFPILRPETLDYCLVEFCGMSRFSCAGPRKEEIKWHGSFAHISSTIVHILILDFFSQYFVQVWPRLILPV